jgi:hypothetical protein
LRPEVATDVDGVDIPARITSWLTWRRSTAIPGRWLSITAPRLSLVCQGGIRLHLDGFSDLPYFKYGVDYRIAVYRRTIPLCHRS